MSTLKRLRRTSRRWAEKVASLKPGAIVVSRTGPKKLWSVKAVKSIDTATGYVFTKQIPLPASINRYCSTRKHTVACGIECAGAGGGVFPTIQAAERHILSIMEPKLPQPPPPAGAPAPPPVTEWTLALLQEVVKGALRDVTGELEELVRKLVREEVRPIVREEVEQIWK